MLNMMNKRSRSSHEMVFLLPEETCYVRENAQKLSFTHCSAQSVPAANLRPSAHLRCVPSPPGIRVSAAASGVLLSRRSSSSPAPGSGNSSLIPTREESRKKGAQEKQRCAGGGPRAPPAGRAGHGSKTSKHHCPQ